MASEQKGRNEVAWRRAAVAGRGSERILAAVAHGAIVFGFLGIRFLLSLAITGVIWLVSRKSRYVRERSDRAGWYQIFVLVVNFLVIGAWTIGLIGFLYLTNWQDWGGNGWQGWTHIDWRWVLVMLDGVVLVIVVPLFIAWYVGTILYGLYGALRALGGHDFRYPPPPWRRASHPLGRPLRWVE